MLLRPPPEGRVSRAKLFRLFLRTPRPRIRIDFAYPGVDVRLHVVGLRGLDVRLLEDELADRYAGQRELSRTLRVACISALALEYDERDTDATRRALPSGNWLSANHGSRFIYQLGDAVSDGLRIVSPLYGRCDSEAWHYALKSGARHPSNTNDAIALGTCYDDAGSHPEIYFGVARNQLTDGQWMAFRGAQALVQEHRKHARGQSGHMRPRAARKAIPRTTKVLRHR